MVWEDITVGEIASKTATIAAKNYIQTNISGINLEEKEEILKLVRSAMEYANMVVYEKAKENTELENMGTTLEICLIMNNKVYIGHIGDSRIYRIRKEIIRKLTQDHSYVQKLVENGTITKEEALNHPKKNMLTKALGCTAFIEPDVMVKGFLKNDILLLCSDGLTNMVKDEEILNILQTDITSAVDNLIIKANQMGGIDNISAVIIQNA